MIVEPDITSMAAQILERYPVLREINSSTEHTQALELMENLIEHYDANVVLIEALANSIERYEEGAEEFASFNKEISGADSGVMMLRVLMDQYGLKTADFEHEIGKKSMVSQVLSGKRNLTKEHIIKLANRFKISPSSFF